MYCQSEIDAIFWEILDDAVKLMFQRFISISFWVASLETIISC